MINFLYIPTFLASTIKSNEVDTDTPINTPENDTKEFMILLQTVRVMSNA